MPRISDKIYVIAVDAADMRGKQAAQKTRHLWNGPSCYLSDVALVSHKRWLHEEGHIEFAHPLIRIECQSSVVEIV